MLEKNINESLVKKDAAASSLIRIISELDSQRTLNEAAIYHHFPIYPNFDGLSSVNANVLFISQNHGIVIFQCVDFSDRIKVESIVESINRLNEVDRLIFAKIVKDAPSLQKDRRSLKIEIRPVLYIHNYDNKADPPSELREAEFVFTEKSIEKLLFEDEDSLSAEEYADLKATIEGSKGILKPTDRNLKDKDDVENSKGAILTKIENNIYNFDREQKRAALFTLDGPQRIRGLAGSGKTIILAMKAAQIHLQNPEAEILYTYYTKTLNDLIKRLITRFYRQFAESDPDWEKIHIMHAWGGYGLEGVYFNACNYNGIAPINLSTAQRFAANPFEYVCEQLDQNDLKKQYDYALLDEAQDFPIHFYRICRKITRNDRVVWAYDDFQNILNVTLQNEKETFGKDSNGIWHIDFERKDDELQDLILYKCYRNPRKILIAAFALGLGVYNYDEQKYKVLQRLENNEHWESLGFTVESGNSKDGDQMTLSRPPENSSILKNEFLNDDSIIRVASFTSLENECKYVAESIVKDIQLELRPEDINVVCVDNRYAKRYFSRLSILLSSNNINYFNLQEAPSDTIIYKVANHVTFSTIYKAKGNEAGSVYIMGIDSIFSNKDSIVERNKIFTAMTRALAWATLTGIGDAAAICKQELDTLKKNEYKLIFKQPSEKEVQTIYQNINKKQAALNKIERLADELSKELGLSKDEIVNELRSKLIKKK